MKYQWRGLPTAIESRILGELNSWRGTRYFDGASAKGVGVNCVYLVREFLDEMYRTTPPTPVPRFSPDAASNRPNERMRVVLALVRAGAGAHLVTDSMEPGDIVLLTQSPDPDGVLEGGHVAILGTRPYQMFHSVNNIGACWSSIRAWPGRLTAVWRPNDKRELWS